MKSLSFANPGVHLKATLGALEHYQNQHFLTLAYCSYAIYNLNMIILNRELLLSALAREGFSSLGALCSELKIHRNSLSRYLSGAPVFPKVLELVFRRLKLAPAEALVVVQDKRGDEITLIRKVVGEIVKAVPERAVILFGSRVKGTARKYSDYDLGILGDKPLSLDQLSRVKEIAEEASEDLPFFIDVIDLNRADKKFMDSLRNNSTFLGGNPVFALR